MTPVVEFASAPDLQSLVQQLQAALGVAIRHGQITLNLNDGRFETYETRTFTRLASKSTENRLTKGGR